jgi:hypothetical protein
MDPGEKDAVAARADAIIADFELKKFGTLDGRPPRAVKWRSCCSRKHGVNEACDLKLVSGVGPAPKRWAR